MTLWLMHLARTQEMWVQFSSLPQTQVTKFLCASAPPRGKMGTQIVSLDCQLFGAGSTFSSPYVHAQHNEAHILFGPSRCLFKGLSTQWGNAHYRGVISKAHSCDAY